ncbi:hypothetical protein MPER_03341, partial [Moniliophthora perniciosa FA553]
SPPPPPTGNDNNNNNNTSGNNGGGNHDQQNSGPVAGSAAGLLSVHSECGDIGATSDITHITGPNGNLYWLNCGLEEGDLFYKHGNENGIPPIVLASFLAMQESTCNPSTVGGGGEVGLMQLTHEKCEGASDCFNPKLLDSNGGNVLQSLGAFNGWYPGMTKDAATSARYGPRCRCQQNLD